MKQTAIVLLLMGTLAWGCSSEKGASHTEQDKTEGAIQPAEISMMAPAEDAALPAPGPVLKQRLSEPTDAGKRNSRMVATAPMGGAILSEQSVQVLPMNRESYNALEEHGFITTANDALSTFSIDVDTAGYANVRRFVTGGHLPPAGAVRIEEMLNYFSYAYPQPEKETPFSLNAEVSASPFHQDYQLARIGLQAKNIAKELLPPSNLVFLLDVSGSMQAANKLPLIKQAMQLLVKQLSSRDRISLVVYAGNDRVVLPPTPADQQAQIFKAIEELQASGSTHASSGIRTAYDLARQVQMPKGNNRVILVSDGDFNVGVTSRDALQRMIEQERQSGIYLTVLGVGMGNYHDDTMEILADKGNGNYAYIDSLLEAKKVLVKELSGTLFTLASDVKIQVEFNPAKVGAYRLIGYENRALADEDFRDDSKDAGEIGVGHRVTALYELMPAGHADIPKVEALKYQQTAPLNQGSSDELFTVKLRYKPAGETTSQAMSLPVISSPNNAPTVDQQFAAAVAGYGMLLTKSPYVGDFNWEACLKLAKAGRGKDDEGYRAEFYRLVENSELLASQKSQPGQPQPVLPQRRSFGK